MKKSKFLIILSVALLSSCNNISNALNKNEEKKESFNELNEFLRVNYLPGIYNEDLKLDFEYDRDNYDLFYTFDSNYNDQISHYFKYEDEGINVYKGELKSLADYPCTTSVDAILSYDNDGKCVSNNYINNIQKTNNYKLKRKQNNLNLILKEKATNEIKMKKTFTYIIDDKATDFYKIPIVSIALPYEDMFNSVLGFYNNIRDDISRRCSLEFIDPYYNEYFNVNSQIKLGGNWTLGYPLRTLNMNFNKDENANKNTPLTQHVFKDRNALSSNKQLTKHTRFRVHSGGNAFEESIGFNDALLQSIMAGSKASTAACRPAICYINGEYWGLTYIREHYKAYYFEQNYGIKKSKIVTYDLKGALEFDDGDEEEIANQKLKVMNDYINNKDFKDDKVYNEFKDNVIDVDSFIDVILAQAYASNRDFIGNFNNLKAWASTEVDKKNPYCDGKIRFCIHDADFAFRDTNNVLDINHANFFGKFPLMNCLMQNVNFRKRLIERATELSNTTFKEENTIPKLESFVNEIKDYKIESAIRWGAYNNYADIWNSEINNVKNNLKKKSSTFLDEVKQFVIYY